MTEVKVDFSVTFQEFNLILECLQNSKADFERKEHLAKQTLSARQDYFIRLIESILEKLQKQALQSTGYYDMNLVRGEMDKALGISEEFMEALRDANGSVWMAIKNSA